MPFLQGLAVAGSLFGSIAEGIGKKKSIDKNFAIQKQGIDRLRDYRLEDTEQQHLMFMGKRQAAKGVSGARVSSGSFVAGDLDEIQKHERRKYRIAEAHQQSIDELVAQRRSARDAANLEMAGNVMTTALKPGNLTALGGAFESVGDFFYKPYDIPRFLERV
tara:strand:- start:22046 stop:22531 length:486 start_codon:yes stop_codon:yes gene_type:complete